MGIRAVKKYIDIRLSTWASYDWIENPTLNKIIILQKLKLYYAEFFKYMIHVSFKFQLVTK